MPRMTKAQIESCEKALRAMELGSHLSITRALEHFGIRGLLAGRLLDEGRAMLSEGKAPTIARCKGGGGTCEGVCDLDEGKPDIIGCEVCGLMGPDAWAVPTALDRLKMRLALADTAASSGLASRAMKATSHILRQRDHRFAGAQARLIPLVLEATEPEVFGAKPTRIEATVKTAGPTWAHGISDEELERLPIEAVEQLRSIAEMQRKLDEVARETVKAALGGIDLPPLVLPSSLPRLDDYPRRVPCA